MAAVVFSVYSEMYSETDVVDSDCNAVMREVVVRLDCSMQLCLSELSARHRVAEPITVCPLSLPACRGVDQMHLCRQPLE